MAPVLCSMVDGVAWVTLNRPAAGNAMDPHLAALLADVTGSLADDPTVLCVVLTGAGARFCAGGDVRAFAAAGKDAPTFVRQLAETVHRTILQVARMPKPVVALVNGPAAGAGLSLALAADIVMMARSAYCVAAYSAIGLTPDGGMSWHLARIVGLRRAQAMLLLNDKVDGEEAVRIGLATMVVDDEHLSTRGRAIATGLAQGQLHAFAGLKRLLSAACCSTLEDQLRREVEEIVGAAGRLEAQQAITRFAAAKPGV